jgi:hypothetical protein
MVAERGHRQTQAQNRQSKELSATSGKNIIGNNDLRELELEHIDDIGFASSANRTIGGAWSDAQIDRMIRSIQFDQIRLSGAMIKEMPVLAEPGPWNDPARCRRHDGAALRNATSQSVRRGRPGASAPGVGLDRSESPMARLSVDACCACSLPRFTPT